MTLWDVFVTTLWFMLLLAWIFLMVKVIRDIFRDDSLGGVGKAAWTLLVVVFPWLGTLTYLIVRGQSMQDRAFDDARVEDARVLAYVQEQNESRRLHVSSELRDLAALRDSGVIDQAEYDAAKARVLA
jgi:hypothetical protein